VPPNFSTEFPQKKKKNKNKTKQKKLAGYRSRCSPRLAPMLSWTGTQDNK
jgi:hypothetical protein